MKTYAYGLPRLGAGREYKKAIESFWKKQITPAQLQQEFDRLQAAMLDTYARHVDAFPAGEMTAYDAMLDTAIMVGCHAPRDLAEYYQLCRGKDALEMTKWFNTNYHYLVQDFTNTPKPAFKLNWNKPNKNYLIGPFTFLKLSKGLEGGRFEEFFEALVPVYKQILQTLPQAHIDEPALVLELSPREVQLVQKAYAVLGPASKVHLFTYYDEVDALKELLDLPVASIGLDLVRGGQYLKHLRSTGFPSDKLLIAGLVDGRNIWKTDMKAACEILKDLRSIAKNVAVSNAAPLSHLPWSITNEKGMDPRLSANLSFALEKLQEIRALAGETAPSTTMSLAFGRNPKVQERVKGLKEQDFIKPMALAQRKQEHAKSLDLPLFPTTTIGSFPQTADVRAKRTDLKAGRINEGQYRSFMEGKIREVVRFQEDLGLDVLVHGEFERTDMVEFFAQKLDGISTTQEGWIISYGTRTYRPPIIFGDVSRPEPMTVREIAYAQSLTKKPVKGMLTGAVTIIAWSFAREDIPVRDVAFQIALALKDEVRDYEKAGIKIVQVDEAAIREKAPVKKRDWPAYFDWAVKSFRLTTNTDPRTQIHTHMCYSEFGEIMAYVDAMDFDVISIESTRSRGDVIAAFERLDFKKQIGIGVWDIHSPAVPSVEDMKAIVERALKVIPKENFWINPDCGLKTRDWPEVNTSLKNLVTLAHGLR